MRRLTSVAVLYLCIIAVTAQNAIANDQLFRISPFLRFASRDSSAAKSVHTGKQAIVTPKVTIRFHTEPSRELIEYLEQNGVSFFRNEGVILHTEHIFCASLDPSRLSTLASTPEIAAIETTYRPSLTSTLDVSAPLVQSSELWETTVDSSFLDGSGIDILNVDTGVDIYHPGFFKPDGGSYEWIDSDSSGGFTPGIDAVDLNANGNADIGEILNFYEPYISDPLKLIDHTPNVYDVDFDWLYNDSNRDGVRNYGPQDGYSETDPCFGEIVFIVRDVNQNNRLDTNESLTALSTSKIKAIYDGDGPHLRGVDLFTASHDSINHGTGSTGILGGGVPGRRFTGMAPGAEFIVIDRSNASLEEALLWAATQKPDIIQYEFASWVYEFLDGSSNLEVLIDDLSGRGIHQFTASGNLAGPARKKHAFTEIERSGTQNISFNVPDIGISEVYCSFLWRNKYLPPQILFILPDGSTLSIPRSDNDVTIGNVRIQSGMTYSDRQTSRLDILMSSESPFSGSFNATLTNIRATPISVDAYITDNKTQWMNGTQFTSHVTDDGTVCSPGTALTDITVGAYDPRGTRNEKGDLNDFSSWGDTIDGRRAVDITAPGTLVYSYNSHAAIGKEPGSYIDFGGTSAALPHVTGAAAQILQYLRLTGTESENDLYNIISSGAETDRYTGSIPNSKWGYGKIKVLSSLQKIGMVDVSSSFKETPATFSLSQPHPNPFNASLTFSITNNHNTTAIFSIKIFNILGQTVFNEHLTLSAYSTSHVIWNCFDIQGNTLSSGPYILKVMNDYQAIMKKVLYVQ